MIEIAKYLNPKYLYWKIRRIRESLMRKMKQAYEARAENVAKGHGQVWFLLNKFYRSFFAVTELLIARREGTKLGPGPFMHDKKKNDFTRNRSIPSLEPQYESITPSCYSRKILRMNLMVEVVRCFWFNGRCADRSWTAIGVLVRRGVFFGAPSSALSATQHAIVVKVREKSGCDEQVKRPFIWLGARFLLPLCRCECSRSVAVFVVFWVWVLVWLFFWRL